MRNGTYDVIGGKQLVKLLIASHSKCSTSCEVFVHFLYPEFTKAGFKVEYMPRFFQISGQVYEFVGGMALAESPGPIFRVGKGISALSGGG